MSEPGDSYLAERDQFQREVLKAFRVKPWQIGLAPVPWWIRARNKIVPLWLRAWQAHRGD